jgi:hypothetical protein
VPLTGFYTPRDAQALRRFNLWLLAASLTYVGATAAIRWREAVPGPLPWILVALAWVLAVQSVRCYLAFLRGADELLRRIQIEALALGFGAGAVVSLLYPLVASLGAPALEAHLIPLVMMLSWGAGAYFGARRYCRGDSA